MITAISHPSPAPKIDCLSIEFPKSGCTCTYTCRYWSISDFPASMRQRNSASRISDVSLAPQPTRNSFKKLLALSSQPLYAKSWREYMYHTCTCTCMYCTCSRADHEMLSHQQHYYNKERYSTPPPPPQKQTA